VSRPRFSVVIPTRQRHATLGYAIQSVLFQDYPDYELIVMDNCSSAETWDVVRQFRTPKLRYDRSPRVLPMNENWEAGLRMCEGEYVFFMGDDDAIMPDGMALADAVLSRVDLDVLSWRKFTYWWDDAIEPSLRGRLFLHPGCHFQILDNKATLAAYYDWKIGMGALPSIYTSFVRRDLTARAAAACGGRYFALGAPDVFTGISNLWFGRQIAAFERGLSIGGNSGYSTGTAWYFRSKGAHRRDAYHADEGQDERGLIHESLIPSVNLEINLCDTQIRAKQLLFPDDDRFQVRIPLLLAQMAANINRDPDSYDIVLREIAELAAKHSIDAASVPVPPRAPAARQTLQGPLCGADGRLDTLALYGPQAGVRDVAQAARLAAAALPVLTIH